MIRKLFMIMILIITIVNFNNIVTYFKKDLRHAWHVQYCNDLYTGHLQDCVYYNTDVK